MRPLKYSLIALGVALFLSAAPNTSYAGPGCIANWVKAVPIIVKNRLIPARAIHRMITGKLGGRLIKVKLCKFGKKYVYMIRLLHRNGRVRDIIIDAHTGGFSNAIEAKTGSIFPPAYQALPRYAYKPLAYGAPSMSKAHISRNEYWRAKRRAHQRYYRRRH